MLSISLLNCFIFICKLMICISIFISINTHHWTRDSDGKEYQGMWYRCYDYGHSCRGTVSTLVVSFFYLITLLNIIFELINILMLCKRTRFAINLLLEELGLIATVLFVVPTSIFTILIFIRTDIEELRKIDWSLYIFLLSLILAYIEFICSLIRVVTYCRNNSFRSNTITYTSNNNNQTVHIQT